MSRSRSLLTTAVAAALLLVATVAAPAGAGTTGSSGSSGSSGVPRLAWRDLPTGSTAQFRGLDVLSRRVVWVAGSAGTVLRTVDGGRSWQDVSPAAAVGPSGERLLFRDVEAFSAREAQALAIGPGAESQVWRTRDGGSTWRATFVNADPDAFYDCMAFLDRRHGLVMGDPVDGRWQILRTSDGGRSWRLLPKRLLPAALDGEFGFAASGTCLTASGPRHAWFAGGGAAARVFRSSDGGLTWQVADTPLAASPDGGGIFSLAFRGRSRGIAVGGDFTAPDSAPRGAAWTRDGGRTWTLADRPLSGYRSGSAWLPYWPWGAVAVGPNGSDVTLDAGRRWYRFDSGNLDAVQCSRDGACFGSGRGGRVARLELRWGWWSPLMTGRMTGPAT